MMALMLSVQHLTIVRVMWMVDMLRSGSGQLLSPVKPTRQMRRQSRAISALSPLTSPSKAFVSIAKSKMLTHAHKKKMHEANFLKRKADEALGQMIQAV